MSSVREKAGLLKLLLWLGFLFFGLLKQVNIAVEGKTIDVIFEIFTSFVTNEVNISKICFSSYEKFVDKLKGGYILKLIKTLNVTTIFKSKRRKFEFEMLWFQILNTKG